METTIRFANVLRNNWNSLDDLISRQSARYPPLLYLIGGSLSQLAPKSYWSYVLPITWFFFLTAFALACLGLSLARRSAVAILPLTVFLANPVAWEMGFSYNLETAVLAAATILLALVLLSEEIHNRLVILLGFFLVGSLSLSKAVVLLPIAPPAVFLMLWGGEKARSNRTIFTSAFIIVAGAWLIFRQGLLLPEFSADFLGDSQQISFGSGYYLRQLLVSYRGAPLLAGLLALLVVRAQEKRLNPIDLALALYFFVPILFFTMLFTKRPWYPLAAFMGLPIWMLHCAKDLWERKWVRRLSYGLTGIYFCLALANIGLVVAMIGHPISDRWFALVEMHKPQPPSLIEKEVSEFFVRQADAHPERRLAITLGNGPITNLRFGNLLFLAAPRLAIDRQLIFTETLNPDNRFFAEALPQSSVFYTFGDAWPEVPLAGRTAKNPEWIDFRRFIAATATLFPEKETITIADNVRMTAFYHRDIANTYRSKSEADFYRESIGTDWFVGLRDKGLSAYREGRYRDAAADLQLVYHHFRADDEVRYRLALSLSLDGRMEDARPVWTDFFSNGRSFGQQVQALEQLAILAGTGKVALELFEHYRADLEARHSADRLERYTLRSLTVFAAQQKKDWPAALSAVSALRETLVSEQIPGVNLVEAQILRELKEYAAAEKLLTENLHATIKDEVFANSAQELARLQAGQGRLTAAKESLALSLTAPFDTAATVETILTVDRKIAALESSASAIRFLRENLSRIPDADTALLYVELGNLLLSGGDRAAAKDAFEKAYRQTRDASLRSWLEDSLRDLR
ncbi:MAG: hypothetical protein GX444_03870 [Myxococcales bacterium]|nr:hypothetical protein [Myxococcales bacterium]